MRQLKISRSITNRDAESLNKYFMEINKLPLISPEEETNLFSLIQGGDKNALDKITKANLRFVVSVAKQYQNQGLSFADLINEGNIGLIHAAYKFDSSKGFKFISYAVWWIRQSIMYAISSDAKMIRVPNNKKILDRKIQKANLALEQTLERAATAEEIAEELKIDPAEIELRMAAQAKMVSLDTPLSDNEDTSLLDTLENPDGVNGFEKESNSGSLKTEIERVMQVLTAKQRETLICFFGFATGYPMSLEEIAKKQDLTSERVRQIKDKALEQLRTKKNIHLLRAFLG